MVRDIYSSMERWTIPKDNISQAYFYFNAVQWNLGGIRQYPRFRVSKKSVGRLQSSELYFSIHVLEWKVVWKRNVLCTLYITSVQIQFLNENLKTVMRLSSWRVYYSTKSRLLAWWRIIYRGRKRSWRSMHDSQCSADLGRSAGFHW